jgi:hypothetical protein
MLKSELASSDPANGGPKATDSNSDSTQTLKSLLPQVLALEPEDLSRLVKIIASLTGDVATAANEVDGAIDVEMVSQFLDSIKDQRTYERLVQIDQALGENLQPQAYELLTTARQQILDDQPSVNFRHQIVQYAIERPWMAVLGTIGILTLMASILLGVAKRIF